MEDKKILLKKSSEIVTREIEGEVILIPIFRSTDNMGCIYTLNTTAAFFWSLIDGKRDLAYIKSKILGKFNVKVNKLVSQLNEIITDLKSIKAINY